MKKTLLFALVSLCYVLNAYSQSDGLLISENFPYPNGNLTGQGSSATWASSGTGGDVVVTALTNNTGALVYPGYGSGQSYVTTSNSTARDPYKGFLGSQSVAMTSAATFYISFVVNVASSSNTAASTFATATVALRTSSGNNFAYFYIADDGSFGTQHLRFGISKTATTASYSTTNYSYNTTYLIVIRYDIVSGTGNDKMYMWINPSLVNEPTTGSANRSITTGTDPSTSSSVSALQLLEDNNVVFGFINDGTVAKLDAFKVAYARGYTTNPTNSVVAWNDLSPAGAPLPVKFGDLRASLQSNGVQLSWSSYSEENTSHYEVERSADGQSYSEIGRVNAAGNSNSKLDYAWLDGEPISGNDFYRVKSVDIDGHLTYSSVIKINIGDNLDRTLSIYPNPVQGSQLTLQVNNFEKGNYTVQFFNRMGQQVGQSQLSISDGNMTQTVQLPSAVKSGTYNLIITNGEMRINKTFVVL